MKSFFFGVVLLIAMVILSIEGDLSNYAQKHSILLVCGGTVALLFVTTPTNALKQIWVEIKSIHKTDLTFDDIKDDLVSLAERRTLDQPSSSALINYAKELWDQGIDQNLFIVLLSQKKTTLENETLDAIQSLKNLSKYPPGLGITGTVMGMITLFSALDGDKNKIGASIALAMTATFFGLFLTNVLIAPLGDRIQIKFMNQKKLLHDVYKILLLINQEEPPELINSQMEEQAVV